LLFLFSDILFVLFFLLLLSGRLEKEEEREREREEQMKYRGGSLFSFFYSVSAAVAEYTTSISESLTTLIDLAGR